MKKLIAIILSLLLCLVFCACGEKEDENNKASVDLEYYANLGQIPECKYKLGADPETVDAELLAEAKAGDEIQYYTDEGEENILFDNGIYNFYYKKDKPEKGISFIATYETAFGFEPGTLSIKVKDAIGATPVEEAADSENSFFVWNLQNGSVLKYSFKNANVLFVFENNALCATAIYNSNWEK